MVIIMAAVHTIKECGCDFLEEELNSRLEVSPSLQVASMLGQYPARRSD